MSFSKLLAAGKSLVGMPDIDCRYRVRTENLLPKFISPKNPFAQPAPKPAAPPAAPAETGRAVIAARMETAPLFEADRAKTEPAREVKVSIARPSKPVKVEIRRTEVKTPSAPPKGGVANWDATEPSGPPKSGAPTPEVRGPLAASAGPTSCLPVAATIKTPDSAQPARSLSSRVLAGFRGWADGKPALPSGQPAAGMRLEVKTPSAPAGGGTSHPAQPAPKTGRWFGWMKKLNPLALLFKGRGGSMASRGRMGKSPVQAELSLDRVQVVRNDLRDADLEIVPGRLMGIPSGASPVLSNAARPDHSGWSRLATHLLGVEHTQI